MMSRSIFAAAAFCTMSILLTAEANAASETVLYNFPAGSSPMDRVVQGRAGALYGTTAAGGHGMGTVYRLIQKKGIWQEKDIYEFSGSDGANPVAALTADPNNVLYGTTELGGSGNAGTLFALTPVKRGWTHSVLHSFTGGSDGAQPVAAVHRDKTTGFIYGTASGGGVGCGTVFAFDPGSDESTIYTFQGGDDGCFPGATLRSLDKGIIVGSTEVGGPWNAGTTFMMTEKNGVWSEQVIYNFTNGVAGGDPGDFDINKDGAIFGVARSGGKFGNGAVFVLSKVNGNQWQESLLYSFRGPDGSEPVGIRLDGSTGTLYGTTANGGQYSGGTAFSLAFDGTSWIETVLHSFGQAGSKDGVHPSGRLIPDQITGEQYGTTVGGGDFGGGTVYAISP